MFCRRPSGRAPEVTGPYCSHTRSGALPPEAWLSSVALAWVMLEVLFGSHWTVTFLWAASYWVVRSFRPTLSAAVIGPVFGGSCALMTTEPPLLLLEPLEEQAAMVPASSSAAAAADTGYLRGVLRMVCTHLLAVGLR